MGSQPSQKPRSVAELLRSCIEAGDGLRSRIGGVLGSRAVAEQALIFLAPKKTLETARFEFLRDFDMVWSLFFFLLDNLLGFITRINGHASPALLFVCLS
jgi:hypothetical protein